MCVCGGGGGGASQVQWYVQLISNLEVTGSIPDEYGRTRLSSLSHSPSSSFILLGGYQQPVYAGVCGVACVCKKMKNEIKGEVKAKIKISPVVVFGVLSRMVLVRGS